MKRTNSILFIMVSFATVLACNGITNPATRTEINTTSVSEPTVAGSIATESIAAALPTPTEPPTETHIAYVQNDILKVTHVIGGKAIDTQEYATSQLRGGIYNVGWSP